MRLINTRSLELQLFVANRAPDYVILSHRWASEELLFEDITKGRVSNPNHPARKKQGFSKVEGACALAARDGYDWIWIDSCCIDKSSSAELQEAINSMWNYYARSNICYVYMIDVIDSEAGWDQRFRTSQWFTRGWTLQELIAPAYVEFYAKDWSRIGTKLERHKEIADITKIDPDVLVQVEAIDSFNAAQKFSWAAHRQVTREEDEAYSLLGLFNVNMPMLYGEGREKSFIRLQEEIYNTTVDHTLFLFSHSQYRDSQPLLADCPTRFCQRAECISCKSCNTQCFPPQIPYGDIIARLDWHVQAHEQIMTTVTPFRNEMSTTVSLLDYQDVSNQLVLFNDEEFRTEASHVAVLNHTLVDHEEGALCLLLFQPSNSEGAAFFRTRLSPALLPCVTEFTSKLQRKTILICPDRSSSDGNERTTFTFTLDSDSFLVRSWRARCVYRRSTVPVQGRLSTDFSIQTLKSGDSKLSTEISSRIAEAHYPGMQISLRLYRIGENWSIKEISEVKLRKRKHKQHLIFSSSTLSDYCSIVLSDGRRLSVRLRRLAASRRARCDGTVSQFRYQIAVRSLEEERGRRWIFYESSKKIENLSFHLNFVW